MLFTLSQRRRIYELWLMHPWSVWAIGALLLLFSLFISFPKRSITPSSSLRLAPVTFDFQKIGQGPLALKGQPLSPLLYSLISQLLFCGENEKGQLLFRLNDHERQLKVGEIVCVEKIGEEFHFAKEGIELEILPENQIKILSEDQVFSPKTREGQVSGDFLSDLKSAKFWGRDLLIQQYGGKDFDPIKEASTVEFSSLHYLKRGDLLAYQGKTWTPTHAKIPGAPLARVTAVSDYEIAFLVWDAKGFDSEQIILPRQMGEARKVPPNFLSDLKQRSARAASGQIEKKRIILKEGDWLFHSSKGWRKLLSTQAIDQVLTFEQKGELFLIDRIESGRLEGTLFNSMRSAAEKLVFPLSPRMEKKK